MKRVCVLLALVCSLLVPSVARADGLESFTRGLNDLAGNGQNEQVTPERDFIESYEPQDVVLSAPATREYDEDSTPVDYVCGTLDEFNRNPWSNSRGNLLQYLQFFFTSGIAGAQGLLLPIAIGIVFMWWGVRKSVRIIMGAFRKGRQSV